MRLAIGGNLAGGYAYAYKVHISYRAKALLSLLSSFLRSNDYRHHQRSSHASHISASYSPAGVHLEISLAAKPRNLTMLLSPFMSLPRP